MPFVSRHDIQKQQIAIRSSCGNVDGAGSHRHRGENAGMRKALTALLVVGSVLLSLAVVAHVDKIAAPSRTGILVPWHPIGPASDMFEKQGVDEGELSPQAACEEAIDWAAAIQGYLKSKLHLTAVQTAAWRTFEQAAEPALEEQRELCTQLPSDTTTALGLSERQELAKEMLAIRADYLRSTEQSRRVLAESLSPEQRAVLNTPPFSMAEVLH
jgi:LTXXQ motif family protein